MSGGLHKEAESSVGLVSGTEKCTQILMILATILIRNYYTPSIFSFITQKMLWSRGIYYSLFSNKETKVLQMFDGFPLSAYCLSGRTEASCLLWVLWNCGGECSDSLWVMYSIALHFIIQTRTLLSQEKDANWIKCQESINMKCPWWEGTCE